MIGGWIFCLRQKQHRRSPKLQDIVPTSLGSKIFMGSLLGYPRDFLVASLTTEKSANMDNSLLKVCKITTRGKVRFVSTFAIALQSIMTYSSTPKFV